MGRLPWAPEFVVTVVGLRGAGIFLASFFALLAGHISNSSERESSEREIEIPECAATVCVALDLGAEADWAPFVLLRVFRMLSEDRWQLRGQGLLISTRNVGGPTRTAGSLMSHDMTRRSGLVRCFRMTPHPPSKRCGVPSQLAAFQKQIILEAGDFPDHLWR